MLPSIYGKLTDIHTSAKNPLGALYSPDGGKKIYMYVKGVASNTANSWVSIDEAHQATLLVANAKGRVGISQSAFVANQYGWIQVFGSATGKVLASFADNGLIYATATDGSVDDAAVAGDLIVGAIGRSAISNGVATVELNFPFATDALGS